MKIQINNQAYKRLDAVSNEEKLSDRAKIKFIVGGKFRKKTGRRFLGYAWIVLDPLILALIYLFVFTVIRARVEANSILIGVVLYGALQSSIMAGIHSISLNGGLSCERIKTSVLIKAAIWHRVIDISLQSFLIAIILIIAFDASILGGVIFLMIGQIMGLLFFGLGVVIAPIAKRIPDIETVIKYVLRIGFYASPAMYPMAKMTGIHYKVMEYNPFSYFVELSRLFGGAESEFENLSMVRFFIFTSLLVIVTIIGIKRIDKLRWRMTTWS